VSRETGSQYSSLVVVEIAVWVSRPLGTEILRLGLGLEALVSAVFETDQ